MIRNIFLFSTFPALSHFSRPFLSFGNLKRPQLSFFVHLLKKESFLSRVDSVLLSTPSLCGSSSSSNTMTSLKRKKKMNNTITNNNNGTDLLSKLSDKLLHHILSFLDMIFVVRTSLLSKRWRYLWTSVHTLNFNEDVFYRFVKKPPQESNLTDFILHTKFSNFVNMVMLLRNESKVQVRKFHLSGKEERFRCSHVDDWVRILVRSCNIQVLDIQLDVYEHYHEFELPDCIFTCESLTTLKLDMGLKAHPCFMLSDSRMHLPNLKTMELRSLWLFSGFVMLISDCDKLETLILSNCVFGPGGTFDIDASELKTLVIESLHNDSMHCFDHCQLNVDAPKLTSLRCKDYTINDYTFGEEGASCPALEEADMDTDFAAEYYSRTLCPRFDAKYWMCARRLYFLNVLKCFKGVKNVTSLTLSGWFPEILVKVAPEAGGMPIDPFYNLRFLTLKTSMSVHQLTGTMIMLYKSPNLESLVLKMTRPPLRKCFDEVNSREEERWEGESVPEFKLDQLKFVEVSGILASVNELEFLKFLLQRASVLEKMVVYTSKQARKNEKDLKRFGEKLISFPAVSLKIGVLFL